MSAPLRGLAPGVHCTMHSPRNEPPVRKTPTQIRASPCRRCTSRSRQEFGAPVISKRHQHVAKVWVNGLRDSNEDSQICKTNLQKTNEIHFANQEKLVGTLSCPMRCIKIINIAGDRSGLRGHGLTRRHATMIAVLLKTFKRNGQWITRQ